MSDMATHLCVMTRSVFILWLALALSVVSIGRGDVRGFVTEDFFNKVVSGDVLFSGGVGDIATEDLFKGILSSASRGCAGKSFYTYSNFITATNSFSGFASNRTSSNNKREIAAFFAHVAHETSNLCYVEEIAKIDYCDSSNTQYPCAPGQQYYGRGPLQPTGNANYGAAGTYLGADLLNNPGLVAQDELLAWKTALWFWNVNSNCHVAMASGQGFKGTIQAINGAMECNGGNTDGVNDRINNYLNYCSRLGVSPGNNVAC